MGYVHTRLGKWFVEERGLSKDDKPALVLAHSFLCDGGMWRGILPSLEPLGRLVVLDSPGHGKSAVPPPFTLEENALALADALEALALRRVIVVGLSWGGMLAMRLALARPDTVAGLALLNTSARPDTLENRIKYQALLQAARVFGLPRALLEGQAVPRMFSDDTRAHRPDIPREFVRTVRGFDPKGVVVAGDAVMIRRSDLSTQLSRIQCPTLVIGSALDVATPLEESRFMAETIPGAKLEVLPGRGHMSVMEDPEAVARVLVPFLREVLA